jgi:hypothetical protein
MSEVKKEVDILNKRGCLNGTNHYTGSILGVMEILMVATMVIRIS